MINKSFFSIHFHDIYRFKKQYIILWNKYVTFQYHLLEFVTLLQLLNNEYSATLDLSTISFVAILHNHHEGSIFYASGHKVINNYITLNIMSNMINTKIDVMDDPITVTIMEDITYFFFSQDDSWFYYFSFGLFFFYSFFSLNFFYNKNSNGNKFRKTMHLSADLNVETFYI